MKIFVPFCESLVDEVGFALGDLVPFQLEYECLRVGEAFPIDDEAIRPEADALADCGAARCATGDCGVRPASLR